MLKRGALVASLVSSVAANKSRPQPATPGKRRRRLLRQASGNQFVNFYEAVAGAAVSAFNDRRVIARCDRDKKS
jgi:hypothetical protein